MNDICSMTGFGHGESEAAGCAFECDVRSVNHRYCDVRVKLPREFARLEPQVLQTTRERIGRGRVEVSIRWERADDGARELEVDLALALRYRDAMADLAAELGLPTPKLSAADVSGLEGVLKLRAAGPDPDAEAGLFEALERALEDHAGMRREEGGALAADLGRRVQGVLDLVDRLAELAVDQLPRLRASITERLEALLDEVPIDPERVLTEAAVVAERTDVTEEIVRLRQHAAAFRQEIERGGRVGRKLDFLAQEMLREANTVGSKAWEAPVSMTVVEIKSEIERIREQVQNVE